MVNINKVGLLAKSNQPRLFRSYSDINNRTTEIYLHSIDERKPWQNWIGTNGLAGKKEMQKNPIGNLSKKGSFLEKDSI